ncbi:transposase [Acetobacter orleanensis NRIC 0473]|nr:transposase [Acetobacter orleanensis JCM 7639]GBR29283.1 transposase [Acetobacter orleanensis NRIC 0473]
MNQNKADVLYGWFRELARRFLFHTTHDVESMLDRERMGRESSPSAGVIDSQSINETCGRAGDYAVDFSKL